MSMAKAINDAIRIARVNMGDLIGKGTLRTISSKTYDAAVGRYVTTSADVEVEYVFDKFTYEEQQAEDFLQTDLKIVLFNPDNNLEPSTEDSMVIHSVEYAIRKADPSFIGGYRPVWTLYLRK